MRTVDKGIIGLNSELYESRIKTRHGYNNYDKDWVVMKSTV